MHMIFTRRVKIPVARVQVLLFLFDNLSSSSSLVLCFIRVKCVDHVFRYVACPIADDHITDV
jgi:hypothetical protein